MNIIKNYLTKNRCYQQAVKRTPIGIQLHTIGTGQGTAQSVADYWNQAAVSACVTYIVDCDTPGKILQCLPEEYYTWADAGYGNKNLITFEICESDYIKYTSGASYNVLDEAKFKADILRGYNTAVLLCADICNRYGWNPTDKLPSGLYLISSHDEGRQAGLSSSHVDPTHVWNRFGLTMDQFRKGVALAMTGTVITQPETEALYRVRKTWADSKTQKGAYYDLDKAKACADANAGYYVFDENGTVIYPEWKKPSVPEKAADWAIATANDNSHGYNNTKGSRGGDPDYACSSFVNEAYRQAGLDLPESATVYTAKMKSIYTKAGFEVVTDEINLKNGKGLEIGDVVLAPGKHVEIYVGNGQLAGARGNANSGKPENGKAGDQSGYEIVVSAYWNYPWTIVLRYVGIKSESGVTVPTKQHRVQAGAFTKKKNANTRIAKLKNKGFDAILKQEGDKFIVQAGLFNDKEKAQALAVQIRAKGIEAIVKEV